MPHMNAAMDERVTIPCWLSPEDQKFPDVNLALREPDGLLALGGDLSPGRLLAAYRKGIFPWYSDGQGWPSVAGGRTPGATEGQPILWWSPDPRAVLFPSRVKISRSLHKTLKQGRYRITMDQAFRSVMEGCAEPRNGVPGTWITRAMLEAYTELHERGFAHSIETWRDGRLVGGLYGVALGRVFFGESMFSRSPDASKVALVSLARQLVTWGYGLIDCQIYTEHLASLGAETLPREIFTRFLEQWAEQPGRDAPWHFTVALPCTSEDHD